MLVFTDVALLQIVLYFVRTAIAFAIAMIPLTIVFKLETVCRGHRPVYRSQLAMQLEDRVRARTCVALVRLSSIGERAGRCEIDVSRRSQSQRLINPCWDRTSLLLTSVWRLLC